MEFHHALIFGGIILLFGWVHWQMFKKVELWGLALIGVFFIMTPMCMLFAIELGLL